MIKNNSGEGIFDNILENSLNNPKTELTFKPNPSIKKDNAFINFMGSRKIEKKIDYLLLTAYYYTQYEQKPRFTLKQPFSRRKSKSTVSGSTCPITAFPFNFNLISIVAS